MLFSLDLAAAAIEGAGIRLKRSPAEGYASTRWLYIPASGWF